MTYRVHSFQNQCPRQGWILYELYGGPLPSLTLTDDKLLPREQWFSTRIFWVHDGIHCSPSFASVYFESRTTFWFGKKYSYLCVCSSALQQSSKRLWMEIIFLEKRRKCCFDQVYILTIFIQDLKRWIRIECDELQLITRGNMLHIAIVI